MQSRISYRNLPQLFLKAREEVLRHFRPILKHYGLTEQQWRILRMLGDREKLEPWEICELCQILSPSLAGVLARMDDMGLITRTRMAEDQRRVIVRLTPAGAQMVAEMSELIQTQYMKLENAIGRELIDELYTALDKLTNTPHPTVEHIPLPRNITTPATPAYAKRARRGANRSDTVA